jgi:adenine-specific DNA-methyltransferase
MAISDLVSYSYEQGQKVLKSRDNETIKAQGQYLTPPGIARYMANQLGEIPNDATLLEAACGSGILVCAIIERLIKEHNPPCALRLKSPCKNSSFILPGASLC